MREDEVLARWEAGLTVDTADLICAQADRIRGLTRERDEALRRRKAHAQDADRMETAMGRLELRAILAEREVERLRAIVDAVEAEVSVTFAALGGGQHAGMPPLPASVAQRWRRILASVSPPAPDPSEEA